MIDFSLPPNAPAIDLPRPAIIMPSRRVVTPAEARGIRTDPPIGAPLLAGFGAGAGHGPRATAISPFAGLNLYEIAQALGLDAGLSVALDAGAASSYSSGQTWTDLAGLANFYRGGGSSAEGVDPTFSGTPGAVTASEYWSFDGGDYFSLAGSNPAIFNSMNKNNANFTILFIAQLPDAGTDQILFATNSNSTNTIGIIFKKRVDGRLGCFVTTGSGTCFYFNSDDAIPTTPFILSISIDEPGAYGFYRMNSAAFPVASAETFDATYSSPSTGNATLAARIGANPYDANNDRIAAGGKLWGAMVFSPALSIAATDSLHDAINSRCAFY